MRNFYQICDGTLEYLAELFIEHEVLDKKGITFATFIDMWRKGKHEEAF